MTLPKLILSSLMFMTSATINAQQALTVADITTNNRFTAARVNTAKLLDGEEVTQEHYTLKAENKKSIYRRSFTAEYTVKDNTTGKTAKIKGQIKVPTMSPDGKHIAFVRDNNIYIINVEMLLSGEDYSKAEKAVTTDGENNKIINGHADWVYEEEFGQTKMMAFTDDGSALAWVRFDETDVKQMQLQFHDNDSYPRI